MIWVPLCVWGYLYILNMKDHYRYILRTRDFISSVYGYINLIFLYNVVRHMGFSFIFIYTIEVRHSVYNPVNNLYTPCGKKSTKYTRNVSFSNVWQRFQLDSSWFCQLFEDMFCDWHVIRDLLVPQASEQGVSLFYLLQCWYF